MPGVSVFSDAKLRSACSSNNGDDDDAVARLNVAERDDAVARLAVVSLETTRTAIAHGSSNMDDDDDEVDRLDATGLETTPSDSPLQGLVDLSLQVSMVYRFPIGRFAASRVR
eukprot:TRINITY_DN27781_c0_g1_i1.p2 TRINITY_DN27781_c0_g1~~TRINITY_DN27781_c0_g1_i1.p2  ORF type:complete len:113 (+),score=17.75 TRINITY_DN27781_c0_g1_i1:508-846(+)